VESVQRRDIYAYFREAFPYDMFAITRMSDLSGRRHRRRTMPETCVELPSACEELVISHDLDATGILGELSELVRLPQREWFAHPNHEKAAWSRDRRHQLP
jgi:hypothetical protein